MGFVSNFFGDVAGVELAINYRNERGNLGHACCVCDARLELERNFVAHPKVFAKSLSASAPIGC
jgi:hypothetical protein